MEKKEVNPIVAIAIGVSVLGLALFFGIRATRPAEPAANSYTPGLPPWQDPKNSNHDAIKAPPTTANPHPH